jgi:hypothetical protein
LDQTVFEALDMEIGNDADLEEESKMSFLEQLVKKQREKN